jgi:hypothetical protein
MLRFVAVPLVRMFSHNFQNSNHLWHSRPVLLGAQPVSLRQGEYTLHSGSSGIINRSKKGDFSNGGRLYYFFCFIPAAAEAGIARSSQSQLNSTCQGRQYGPAGQAGRKNDSYKSHLSGPQSTELTRGPPKLVQHFRL